jgi:hypothetical protein
MGLALSHPKQSPLHDLEGVRFQVDEDKQQPIFRRRQWTVLIGRIVASGARLPIEAPVGDMGLEGGFKGRDQRLKLLYRQAGQIQHLCRVSLEIGEP